MGAEVKRPQFSFGGCVYRMQVDTRHAGSLAMMAQASASFMEAPQLADVDYMHTSNLPAGRCLWLRRQIEATSLKWAVSVDGDTTFDSIQLLRELSVVDGNFAVGLAPVRIGGTESLCNLCIKIADEEISSFVGADGKLTMAPSHGRRAYAHELDAVLKGDRIIASGGFGVAVFNLAWFRANWKEPAPERVAIDTGEDIEFCRSVRARGGMIAALRVRTDHYAWGEKMTR